MYNLGVFYARGLGGFEPDVDRARQLFKAAARLGQKEAVKALILEKESIQKSNDDGANDDANDNDSKSVKDENLQSHFRFPSSNSTGNSLDSTVENLLTDLNVKTEERENSFVCRHDEFTSDSSSYDNNDSGILDLSPQSEPESLFV